MYDSNPITTRPATDLARAPRRFAQAALALAALAICANVAALAQQDAQAPDAVYELWEQDWTLKADGSIVYHENKHLRLNSDRVFRAFGDPRFAYNADNQKLEILTARTRLPNGKYVELADYSSVEVAPDAAGGWPAFGALRQRVLVMGGIEPGCVLENEFRITTKAGARPYLAADLHIDNHYPVRSRTITVTVPRGKELSPVIAGLAEDDYVYSFDQRSDGSTTHRWVFAALPGQPNEPQALPWRERGVRLAFTTAPNGDAWVRERLATIDAAANESPILSKLAQDWTADQLTASDKLGAIQSKLADTFNFVNFDVDWRPAKPRNASDVIHHNYGLPTESAAVLLSLARAAGVAARPALLVADGVWNDLAPQASMVAEYVLALDGPAGTEIWHPRHGRIQRSKRWSGYTLISAAADQVSRVALPAWENADDSRCVITGALDLDDDGALTGKLSIRTTGLFVSPGSLETRDGQRSRVESIIAKVLPDASLDEFTLKALTADTFEVEATVESDGALDQLHGCYELAIAGATPASSEVPLPTVHSRRTTSALLTGAFDERIDLTVNWPESFRAVATPKAIAELTGPWGLFRQGIERTDNGVRLTRCYRILRPRLTPAELLALRQPLNACRSSGAHTLVMRP